MSETPRTDRDEQLSALYRAASPEAPPLVIDEAIRAAARRAVGARPQPAGASFVRKWQMPLSIAAVLVLCVSLITVMRDEGSELTQVPRADVPAPARVREANENALPKIELAEEATRSKSLGLKPPAVRSDAPVSGADAYKLVPPVASSGIRSPSADQLQEAKRDAVPAVVDTPARRAAPSAFVEKTEVAGVAANVARDNARRDAAPPAGPAQPGALADARGRTAEYAAAPAAGGQAARQQAATADRVERDAGRAATPEAPPVAKPAAPPVAIRVEPIAQAVPAPAVASAVQKNAVPAEAARPPEKSAKESADGLALMAQLPPEKWLARIDELRTQGRVDEARAGLAEFRKRYPDYVLPPALRGWAQP